MACQSTQRIAQKRVSDHSLSLSLSLLAVRVYARARDGFIYGNSRPQWRVSKWGFVGGVNVYVYMFCYTTWWHLVWFYVFFVL